MTGKVLRVLCIVTIATCLLVLELTLRFKWGFGTMLLFDEDPAYEYIARPNQDIVRLGNRMMYNELSMRSAPLKIDDTCIILGFGDSVINGGSLTDQDSLATTILDHELGNDVRVLNVSAGSWGPDNCAAYLKKYGDFNARLILLVVSSHDSHDNMQFEKIVGQHPSYPDKQYPLATWEVISRYLRPRIAGLFGVAQDDNLMINKDGKEFNSGFEFFRTYCDAHSIPLLVYLHAEEQEIADGKFDAGGQEIIGFCEEYNIPYISGLDVGEAKQMYVDQIHFNASGQKLLAKALLGPIREYAKDCY